MTSSKAILHCAQEYVRNFNEEHYEPNMLWLSEVQQSYMYIIKQAQCRNEVLLPRTPSGKRKFVDVEKANLFHSKESTFRDAADSKKLKIDDLSTIIDTSVIDFTNTSINNTSRSLRPRKQKRSSQLRSRSKRVASKKKGDVKSVVIAQDFIPPSSINNVTTFNSKSKNGIGGINSGKLFKDIKVHINFEDTVINMKDTPDVTMQGEGNSTTREILSKDTLVEDSISTIDPSFSEQVAHTAVPVHGPTEPVAMPRHVFASTPDRTGVKTIESNVLNTSCISIEGKLPVTGGDVNTTENAEEFPANDDLVPRPDVHEHAENVVQPAANDKLVADHDVNEPTEDVVHPTANDNHDVHGPSENVPETPETDATQEPKESTQTSPLSQKSTKKPADILPEPVKSPEDTLPENYPRKPEEKSPQRRSKRLKSVDNVGDKQRDEEKENVPGEFGRRDTYKVMVEEIIDGNSKKPVSKVDVGKPNLAVKLNFTDKDVKKGPKIAKHVKPGGNVVSNVKSFLKRPASPKMEMGYTKPVKVVTSASFMKVSPKEGPVQMKPGGNVVTNAKSFVQQSPQKKTKNTGQVAKKAAEFEKKEKLREYALKEAMKKKQQQIDEKKKLREERERQMAEQQQKILEENEIKRKRMETREEQAAKNQEEIRKAKELEEKQRKELRDAKKADLDARRQREEEEQRRKAEELMRDEKRKQEVLQRRCELEEQKRIKKKAEKEMVEKDKLRLVEEARLHDEERKKKLFEEKEKHRDDVKRKKEEEREKDILERLVREEKNREAEKEISDARKREEDRKVRDEEKRKAREKLREEIKEKLNHEYNQTKTVVDVPTVLRASPRLKFKSVPLVQRDSVYTDYGLDDLSSGDSTDDESEPAKRIPSWAQGSRLKKQLIRQFCTNIDADDIFVNCMETLQLEKIFKKNKKIYFTRSSSAHWSSPPIKNNNGYNMH